MYIFLFLSGNGAGKDIQTEVIRSVLEAGRDGGEGGGRDGGVVGENVQVKV